LKCRHSSRELMSWRSSGSTEVAVGGVGVGVVRVQAVPLPQVAAAPIGDVEAVVNLHAQLNVRYALCAGTGHISPVSAPTGSSEGPAGRVSMSVVM
jgi:hypothetical protein